MLLDRLYRQKLIHPPKFVLEQCSYLTQMGSVAYGVSGETSDIDVYGFCIPSKEVLFPHLAGKILGFGSEGEQFQQWQEHHVKDVSKQTEYDFVVYNIVKYFNLCMENNPNLIDSLFTPDRCVLHATKISDHVRANRKLFLHKGAFHKFKGYAYAQMKKIKDKVNSTNPKRAKDIETFGYDTKFSYHLVRLFCECEQILIEHDLDLERNSEQLKSIRRGEWTLERIEEWFAEKEKSLEMLYASSNLQHQPDEEKIRKLLLECIEMQYGNIDSIINVVPDTEGLLSDLKTLIAKYA